MPGKVVASPLSAGRPRRQNRQVPIIYDGEVVVPAGKALYWPVALAVQQQLQVVVTPWRSCRLKVFGETSFADFQRGLPTAPAIDVWATEVVVRTIFPTQGGTIYVVLADETGLGASGWLTLETDWRS